jgi:hypothetical protein
LDELRDTVRRHAPAHDAADVALMAVDHLGKPLPVALPDPTDNLDVLVSSLAKG